MGFPYFEEVEGTEKKGLDRLEFFLLSPSDYFFRGLSIESSPV
jgi:hypothetical protein